jgi:hypothetical protein
MFSVNWLTVLVLVLAVVLIRLAVTGRYAQVWQALTSIPLTPAQAQQQASQSLSGYTRIG